jgi:hypothetical protein
MERSGRSASPSTKRLLTPAPVAWPAVDFTATELPSLAATQIMAVRIDRRGAPLGIPKKLAYTAPVQRKQKTRAVTLGGWRTGVTAVKHSCASASTDVCVSGLYRSGLNLWWLTPLVVVVVVAAGHATAAGKFMGSGAFLGQPRTLFWADAKQTVPLRNLKLGFWDISADQLLGLSITHTSMVELSLKVGVGC